MDPMLCLRTATDITIQTAAQETWTNDPKLNKYPLHFRNSH